MKCQLEFGDERLRLTLPDSAAILTLPDVAPLARPAAAILQALDSPMAAPALREVIRAKREKKPDATAVVVVSDNTRPVPYRGEQGVLAPILAQLRASGVKEVTVLVATGTHRGLSDDELRRLLPPEAFSPGITVVNHDCRDASSLRAIGRTRRGTEVAVNRRYLDADIRILTGLVEPHFMAGVSGGPKSICPGLIGERATYVFHGAPMMAHERASSLVMEGNPCQDESREVARMAESDFVVNVTISRDKRLTGVFAGELQAVHRAATAKVMKDSVIRIRGEYDVVVTHAGFVGINHYQAAKAAVEACRALATGGSLILAANNTDHDPVGSANYRRLLPFLTELGPDGFDRKVCSSDWAFVPDQWEVQMWGRAVRKVGPAGRLVYCAPQLTGAAFTGLPGVDGGAGIAGLQGRDLAEAMVQRAIDHACQTRFHARVAVLADGPYGVPCLTPGE